MIVLIDIEGRNCSCLVDDVPLNAMMWVKKDLPDGDWPIQFKKGSFGDAGCSEGAEELSKGGFNEVSKIA